MNKFQTLVKRLIGKRLWRNEITYIPRHLEKNGINQSIVEDNPLNLHAIVSYVDKMWIDNTNILKTDLSVYVSSLDISPKKEDLIKYNDQIYSIVQIIPVGNLNNIPVVYNIIVRLA